MPTPVNSPIEAIETRVLNGVVQVEEKTHRFLTDLLFPQRTWLPIQTAEVQIDQDVFDPIMAPFVETNGEAVQLSRQSGNTYSVKTPYIPVKMTLTGSEELLKRSAGQSAILAPVGGVDVISENLTRLVANDTRTLMTSISEREEWMIAQMLQGTITYSAENRANWTVAFNKPAGNNVVPATYWDQAGATFLTDLQDIKRIQNGNNGPGITDAICSTEAGQAITAAVEAGDLAYDNDRNVPVGRFSAFVEDYNEQGVIYLGTIGNIRFWEYGESVKEEDRVTTEKLIRPGYIEFVSVTQKLLDMNTLYYGVMTDIEAIMNNLHIARRFTKVKMQDDPSAYIQYMYSRPLPVPKRPDWYISFEAVNVP